MLVSKWIYKISRIKRRERCGCAVPNPFSTWKSWENPPDHHVIFHSFALILILLTRSQRVLLYRSLTSLPHNFVYRIFLIFIICLHLLDFVLWFSGLCLQERKMIDRFRLYAKGGEGGSGCSSFHRSRHDRHGRPDGGFSFLVEVFIIII